MRKQQRFYVPSVFGQMHLVLHSNMCSVSLECNAMLWLWSCGGVWVVGGAGCFCPPRLRYAIAKYFNKCYPTSLCANRELAVASTNSVHALSSTIRYSVLVMNANSRIAYGLVYHIDWRTSYKLYGMWPWMRAMCNPTQQWSFESAKAITFLLPLMCVYGYTINTSNAFAMAYITEW